MGITKGMRISPWTSRFPLNERFRANASGKPMMSRMTSEPTVKTNELRTVCQKVGSANSRW